MFIKGWALTKSPPTYATFKRLLSRVSPLMLNERRKPAEGFPAFLALEGSLPTVRDPVLSE